MISAKNIAPHITIILFLFIFNISFGQNDYRDGFIISGESDTTHGLINLRSNYQNSRHCEFKKNHEADPEIFPPGEIKAYKFDNGKFYVSKDITLEDTEKKVFLEILLDGIVDLFYYKAKDDEYFFVEKNEKLHQLSNNEIEIRNGNVVKYVRNSNQYKGALTYLFQESPELKNKINDTRFTYRSLINITKDYHENVCDDYKCVDYTRSTNRPVYLEPHIALVNSWLGLKSSNDLSLNTKAAIGINFRFKPLKVHYLWNVLLGISYSTNTLQGDFINSLYNYEDITYRIRTDYTIIRVPIMLEYSFPAKTIQPFLSVGYNNVFLLNPDYEVRSVYYSPGGEETHAVPRYTDLRRYQYGLLAGLGARYLMNDKANVYVKLDFEYRFPSANLNHVLDYINVRSILVSLGYSFSLN